MMANGKTASRVAQMTEKLTKVSFSNLDKILYPKLQITKAQFIEYYIKMAPKMLPFLANRPLVLTRYPEGVDKEGFYMKDAPQGMPDWVKTVRLYSETAKRYVRYILCSDLDTLIWLANLAAVEIHMPLSKTDDRTKPDFAFFDVDPEPPATIEDAAEVALQLARRYWPNENRLSINGHDAQGGRKPVPASQFLRLPHEI